MEIRMVRSSQSWEERKMEEEHSRQREQAMQRPRGTTMPGMLEKEQGGPCGWSRVTEGERGRRGGQRGDGGQAYMIFWTLWRTWAVAPRVRGKGGDRGRAAGRGEQT